MLTVIGDYPCFPNPREETDALAVMRGHWHLKHAQGGGRPGAYAFGSHAQSKGGHADLGQV